jgi:hypothetical protein
MMRLCLFIVERSSVGSHSLNLDCALTTHQPHIHCALGFGVCPLFVLLTPEAQRPGRAVEKGTERGRVASGLSSWLFSFY